MANRRERPRSAVASHYQRGARGLGCQRRCTTGDVRRDAGRRNRPASPIPGRSAIPAMLARPAVGPVATATIHLPVATATIHLPVATAAIHLPVAGATLRRRAVGPVDHRPRPSGPVTVPPSPEVATPTRTGARPRAVATPAEVTPAVRVARAGRAPPSRATPVPRRPGRVPHRVRPAIGHTRTTRRPTATTRSGGRRMHPGHRNSPGRRARSDRGTAVGVMTPLERPAPAHNGRAPRLPRARARWRCSCPATGVAR